RDTHRRLFLGRRLYGHALGLLPGGRRGRWGIRARSAGLADRASITRAVSTAQVAWPVGYAFVPGRGRRWPPERSMAAFPERDGHVDQSTGVLQCHEYLGVGPVVGDQVGDPLGGHGGD